MNCTPLLVPGKRLNVSGGAMAAVMAATPGEDVRDKSHVPVWIYPGVLKVGRYR